MEVRKSTLIIFCFLLLFWIVGSVPFVLQELTHDKCETVRLAVNNLCQAGMICLGLWTLRSKTDIAIIIVTVGVSYYSTCSLNGESTLTWLNGLRRYAPYMFVLPVIRYLWSDTERRERFVAAFDKTLYIFLVVQFPCLSLQALMYGMGDEGGGSLGWYNSGVISQLIYMISFYLMVRRWNPRKGYMANLGDNYVLLLLLLPSFLNETKISFIFLLLYFLMLLPFDRYLLRRLLVIIPLLFFLMGGMMMWYSNNVNTRDDLMDAEYMNDYVFGDNMIDLAFDLLDSDVDTDDVWEADYARGIKFALLPTLLERGENGNELWGYGVGQFKGGNGMEKTKFAKHYEWILRGTQTEMFDAVVELGYVGGTLLIVYWIVMFRFFKRVGKGNRNRRMQWWLGLNMLMMILYAPAFDSLPFVCIALYMVFASSRWSELPPYKETYIFFPPKKPQPLCLPQSR